MEKEKEHLVPWTRCVNTLVHALITAISKEIVHALVTAISYSSNECMYDLF